MQFSQKIYGFRQKESQGFYNPYNSINKTHLIFIFTIYQNYTLALSVFYHYLAYLQDLQRPKPDIVQGERLIEHYAHTLQCLVPAVYANILQLGPFNDTLNDRTEDKEEEEEEEEEVELEGELYVSVSVGVCCST